LVVTTFHQLFSYKEDNQKMAYDYSHSFLYWRRSPRGMVKFGITHLPWERLRMQQQGTDEIIQFDHIWMIRSLYPSFIKMLESHLKTHYMSQCLHNITKRAGHTEWYSDVEITNFIATLAGYNKLLNGKGWHGEIKKIPMKQPYLATKSSECPFGSPSNSRHQTVPVNAWASRFWYRLNPDEDKDKPWEKYLK
jgi:hypothetical protein